MDRRVAAKDSRLIRHSIVFVFRQVFAKSAQHKFARAT